MDMKQTQNSGGGRENRPKTAAVDVKRTQNSGGGRENRAKRAEDVKWTIPLGARVLAASVWTRRGRGVVSAGGTAGC